MFDHVGIRVSDVAVSACFYEAALAPLGCELCSQDAASAGFGPPGAPALWLVQAPGGPKPALAASCEQSSLPSGSSAAS